MLPLDESIITIVGPNGSGKTTLLDAMRTVLALNTSRKRSTRPTSSIEPPMPGYGGGDESTRSSWPPPVFPVDHRPGDPGGVIGAAVSGRQYRIEPGDVGVRNQPQEERFLGVQEYRHRRRQLEPGGPPCALARTGGDGNSASCRRVDVSVHVFGDRETLDEYQRARVNQLEAAQELQELALQVDRLESQVTLSNRVALFQRYQNLLAAQKALETIRLPQAQYVASRRCASCMRGFGVRARRSRSVARTPASLTHKEKRGPGGRSPYRRRSLSHPAHGDSGAARRTSSPAWCLSTSELFNRWSSRPVR